MRVSLSVAAVVAFAAVVLPVSASAADCAAPYSSDALLEDLATVEAAAQTGDQGVAIKVATKMEAGLGCLEEKLVPMLVGRTYRSIGAGYFVGGSTDKASRWLRTAVEVDPAYGFGTEEFAADHPIRAVYEQIKMAPGGVPRPLDAKELTGGKFFLDGRSLSSPSATSGRPHLLQRAADGIDSWVIDGNGFPDEVLSSAAVADVGDSNGDKVKAPKAAKEPKVKAAKEPKVKAPKEPKVASADGSPNKPVKEPKAAKPPKAPSSNSDISRVRPAAKTPLLIAGGAIIAGAGGLYGASIASRQKFNNITDSSDDLRRAQQTTNALYFGSIAALAVGAGTLTWGVMVDGGTPMPTMRVRF
ncbi:MAG: hypothetical protein AB8H79_23340 [Myxococcota bacterium]